MRHTKQHYLDAASELKTGALGSAFGKISLSEDAVSNIHLIAKFKDNAELMGLASGSVESLNARGLKLARTIQAARTEFKDKAKRTFDTVMFLTQLDNHIADLERDIANAEAGFEAKHGDAWLEVMANKLLDPDEIPQKTDDETIEEYRDRLRPIVIAKMIDPATGEIRPEYLQDKETATWAEWAKDQYDIAKAKDFRAERNAIEQNPNLARAEKDESHSNAYQSKSYSELMITSESDDLAIAAQDIAHEETDNRIDNRITQVASAATIEGF